MKKPNLLTVFIFVLLLISGIANIKQAHTGQQQQREIDVRTKTIDSAKNVLSMQRDTICKQTECIQAKDSIARIINRLSIDIINIKK